MQMFTSPNATCWQHHMNFRGCKNRLSTLRTSVLTAWTIAVVLSVFFQIIDAQNDPEGGFPPKIDIPLGPVQGAVAATTTNIYVSTQQGAIYLADVKSGDGKTLNPGGDGQTFGDLCVDSREDQTLYGVGRSTGLLFALTADGKLVRRFALTPVSSTSEPHYISSCIQSRYFLLVTDAYTNIFYKFDLQDTGPERGHPPPLSDKEFQGTPVKFGGQWEAAESGALGAMSLEWSSLWNETAFVLNSNTGKIYSFPLKSTGTASLKVMNVGGKQKVFPGATKIMFDSTNEYIMYVLQPGRNAIAVIEIDPDDVTVAKYIRTLTSPLIDAPVGLSEFGEWLYVLNGRFGTLDPKERLNMTYTLVQIPKHVQHLDNGADSDGPFTPVPDGEDPPQKEVYSQSVVKRVFTSSPVKTGKRAPPPLDEERIPSTVPGGKPKRTPPVESDDSNDGDGNVFTRNNGDKSSSDSGGGGSCFPSDAVVLLDTGETIAMSKLRIGDRVLVAGPASLNDAGLPSFSTVYLFTHRDSRAHSTFVRLHHEMDGGAPLILSPGHYLYINGHLKAAYAVRVGDSLHIIENNLDLIASTSSCLSRSTFHHGSSNSSARESECNLKHVVTSRIVRIDTVVSRGLFNPQTLDGRLVVNNVAASTYTTAVDPQVAALLLFPFRLLASCGGSAWLQFIDRLDLFSQGSRILSSMAPRGPSRILLSHGAAA